MKNETPKMNKKGEKLIDTKSNRNPSYLAEKTRGLSHLSVNSNELCAPQNQPRKEPFLAVPSEAAAKALPR
jgi:hypothetical protein